MNNGTGEERERGGKEIEREEEEKEIREINFKCTMYTVYLSRNMYLKLSLTYTDNALKNLFKMFVTQFETIF
jgi:hypothetical protein